jgi:hypothetical protein
VKSVKRKGFIGITVRKRKGKRKGKGKREARLDCLSKTRLDQAGLLN